jgi:ATP-dependent DNA helicase RecG
MDTQALYICLVHLDELTALVLDIRHEGSDTAEVEVKQAANGFPDSLMPTLSAFANTPGEGP